MRYHSKSSLISVPWFEKIVADTLDQWKRNVDMHDTPFLKSRVGRLHKDCAYLTGEKLEKAMLKRQRKLIALYIGIRDNGYTNENPLLVSFDENGELKLFDGFHRIAILKYLNMDVDVELETNWTGMSPPTPPPKGKDFPLAEVLLKEHPAGKWLYQPVDDKRLTDWKVARTDSKQRLDFIVKSLMGKSVLEVGCSEGYFSRELAKRGYDVTAIDKSPGYIATDKYLATINGVSVKYEVAHWQDYLKQNCYFDNILLLSVLHNDMKFMPVQEVIDALPVFRGKCFRLLMEVPNNDAEKDWSGEKFDFLKDESVNLLEQKLDMDTTSKWKGWRQIYTMNKKATMKSINIKEWESHNSWESSWWGDCKDTLDEQLKQETYASLMKLDQFAVHRHGFNLKGMSIIDIGGGPVSLLLRCYNYRKGIVLDPCEFPKWVAERYKIAKIEYIKKMAEETEFDEIFDEAWIYNCLQHVQDPEKIVKMAIKSAKKVRVVEPLNVGVHRGHPQNLTKEGLDNLFGREGLAEYRNGVATALFYFGVFKYEKQKV